MPEIDYSKLQSQIAKKQITKHNRELRAAARKYEAEQESAINEALDFIENFSEDTPITLEYIFACSKAAVASEYFGNKERDKEQLAFAKECAEIVKNAYVEYIFEDKYKDLITANPQTYGNMFFTSSCACLDILARQRDFDSYLLAREFARDDTKKFYIFHRKVMIKNKLIRDCQDLIDGTIRKLIIEAPPGTGKSAIGEAVVAFLNGLDPAARCLIGTAKGDLADGFYNDFLAFYQIVDNNDYRHNAIFGNVKKYYPDGSANLININVKEREPNLMVSTVEKGGTGRIHINPQGILYLDDVVPNYETATNPDRLKKMNKELKHTFYDRRENAKVRFLGIATPWSKYDYFATKKEEWKNNKYFRLNSTPAYYIDETGKKVTNFPYDWKFFKSVAYWEEQMGEEENDTISQAKYLMKYIETDGTPFNADLIKNYYTKLPDRKPDRIIAFGDVATAIGGDYFSYPIGYVYEKEQDIYVHDWVCSNEGIDKVRPRIISKTVEHKANAADFEVVDVGKSEIDKIRDGVHNQNMRNCLIRSYPAKNSSSKRDRILARESSIKGIATAVGSYNIWFLDKALRKNHIDYNTAMQLLFGWSDSLALQKTQIDDPPDSLAGLISMCDGSGKTRINTSSYLSKLL